MDEFVKRRSYACCEYPPDSAVPEKVILLNTKNAAALCKRSNTLIFSLEIYCF